MTRCGLWPWVGSREEKEIEISRVFISALNSSAAYLESINQSLDSYNYDNKAVADIIMDNVQKVKFEGISVLLAIFFCNSSSDKYFCREQWPSARTLETEWP